MPNWKDVLDETTTFRAEHNAKAKGAIDFVRRSYLEKFFQHTHRNVIAYYSGFLSKPEIDQADINDEDKNGFMMAIHKLDRKLGLDLILHTPGGGISATQSIVDYLRAMFGKDIRAIVPQIAMSAGTMVACSCREIWMTRHSNLGPIDPQLRGVPAQGVVQEFKRAFKEIKADSTKLAVWQPILNKYHPTFLSQCENAIKLSADFVREQLSTVMFEGDARAKEKARSIVRALNDYSGNKTHSRHIHFDECEKLGLKVFLVETDQALQDLLLTVHHCYMHSLMNTPAFKMIENHLGVAFVKQQVIQVVQPQQN